MTSFSIFHINTEKGFRGGELQTLLLARELQQQGHRNVLIAQDKSPLATRARAAGIPTLEWRMRGELDLLSIRKLRRAIQQYQPQILHAHTPHAFAMAILAQKRNTPAVVFSRRVTFPLRSRAKFRRADAIIAVSQTVKNQLISQNFPESKIFVAESGTDFQALDHGLNREAARRALGLPEDAFVIGNVSYFEKTKGQHLLIQTFANLKSGYLLLAGTGPTLRECKQLCAVLKIEERVLFTGQRDDLADVYPAMDVFFLSSFHPEGWSGVLRESMGSRIPVIAVRQPVTEEQIRHEETGILVSQETGKWTEAMERLRIDSGLRNRMAERARTFARQFTVKAMTQKTLACYDHVIHGK